MIQILATIGVYVLIAGFITAEMESRRIEQHFIITVYFKNVFFIYLLYKWIGTFM